MRECAFSSCDKVERTAGDFKMCSGCRTVWYCSAEHQALDWAAVHKKKCASRMGKAVGAQNAAGSV